MAACAVQVEADPTTVKAPAPTLADIAKPGEPIRVIPVKPGHPREPRPKRFEIDRQQGVIYVREADWPTLKAKLQANRAQLETPIAEELPHE